MHKTMASNLTELKQKHRLERQAAELIDRSKPIEFTFNGKRYTAYEGDTIASALSANGVRVIARSFKYHRPRGLRAFGHSMNATVQIGNRPSESVWLTKVRDGMVIDPVNVWPSLNYDAMSMTKFGDRFLPVGFYYKTFIRPTFMWPTYEGVIRRLAGLGRVDLERGLDKGFDKQYLHADVVVVGGGPAGCQAAISAAQTGARVMLFDEGERLGGHLLYSVLESEREEASRLAREVQSQENIELFLNTTIKGWFEDHWLFGVRGKRMFKIRGKASIFATGAEDQPLIFDNNDIPGVMLASAAQRLLTQYGTVPGNRVVIATANDDGWQLAHGLRSAGVNVVGVADLRSEAGIDTSGIEPFWGQTIVRAHGQSGVSGATLAPVDRSGKADMSRATRLSCDLILLSTAYTPRFDLPYLAGAKFRFDEGRREFLPKETPAGVFVAGRVTGAHALEDELEEADLAGKAALRFLGAPDIDRADAHATLTTRKNSREPRSAVQFRVHTDRKMKQFVDLDEDVTTQDMKDSVAEGFNSIELIKRYSTVGTGPSQGKWSSVNGIRLTAELNGWTIEKTGKTTSRAPIRPIKMGNLGGQMMEPVRTTPIHQWHRANGAKMMVAGLWMRPEHYGDPAAEVKAVRERVGLIDVSTLGKIKLTGPGVPGLLDKLYINKFSKLKVGRVRYGVMCTDEGVISDDGVTARISKDEWYMSTTSGGAGKVFETIQWWIQSGWGDGVHVTSVTEGRAAFNLAGPKTRELLQTLTDGDLSHDAFPYMSVREMSVAGVPCRLMRIGFTGELSYEIHAPASQALNVWRAIMDAGQAFGISPFGVEAQRILRLEKAHFIVGQDTDALTDPVMADLEWAIKMEKDDFLGQRMVGRALENGAKQKLTGFKMVDDPTLVPEEGLQIVEDCPVSDGRPLGLDIIGWVTSSRFSPTLGETIGLCWLPSQLAAQNGAEFTIRRNGTKVKARVFHGPFVDPDGGRLKG